MFFVSILIWLSGSFSKVSKLLSRVSAVPGLVWGQPGERVPAPEGADDSLPGRLGSEVPSSARRGCGAQRVPK